MANDRAAGGPADTKSFYDNALREALERIGGEYHHLALFTGEADDSFDAAKARSTETMAAGLSLGPEARVLEVACGVGAASRYLAARFGCRVEATNISEQQLARAQELTEAAGLADRVGFAEGDFHALDFPDESFDLWWCQEALLHSPDKEKVLREAYRVLRPGGWAVLSDVTVPALVPDEDRRGIYARVQTDVMWDPLEHLAALTRCGFKVRGFHDWSAHVAPSYDQTRAQIAAHKDELLAVAERDAVERVLDELALWVDSARAGKIGWVCFQAQK
ncbi:MAG: methyltransferase domain-containing protein [Kiloniellales bacterium]|nr:methyltransferase domain-containing protein [Kiloniellales bacterium]